MKQQDMMDDVAEEYIQNKPDWLQPSVTELEVERLLQELEQLLQAQPNYAQTVAYYAKLEQLKQRREMLAEEEWFNQWLLEELYKAFMTARLGKRRTIDENSFEANMFENLINLRDDIVMRRYKPSRGIAFIISQPVVREIFAAPFRDRVVHHLLFNMVEDWWDRHFLYDSYSCRKGKGTLFGIQRLAQHVRSITRNYTEEAYVVKLDIQGYFMSLPRDRLYERAIWGLERQFPKGGSIYELCKYLWHEIIFDNPIEGVRRRGSISDWRRLPRSKSLFCQPPGKGIVIGNLSSQLLSNIYLDQLDRFITYDLGYKHYGRYVDDFFYLVPAKQLEQAKKDIHVIEAYLRGLDLTLHPRKRYIQNIRRGIPFLGTVVYPGRIVPSRRIVKNFSKAVRRYTYGMGRNEVITSYLGQLKHIDGNRVKMRVFKSVGWEYEF